MQPVIGCEFMALYGDIMNFPFLRQAKMSSTGSSTTPLDGREQTYKRRRLNEGYQSPGYSSPDELAATSVYQVAKPRPRDSHIRKSSPKESVSRRSFDDGASLDESPDELDHTFFQAGRHASAHTPPGTSSEAAESTDGDYPSSQASSPIPPYLAPEVRYTPRLVLTGHKRGVSAVKFSPNGKWIASCCRKKSLPEHIMNKG